MIHRGRGDRIAFVANDQLKLPIGRRRCNAHWLVFFAVHQCIAEKGKKPADPRHVDDNAV